MTLSGKSDGKERIAAGREARQERAAQQQTRKPWLMPVIIGVAVLILAFVVYMTLTGQVKGL